MRISGVVLIGALLFSVPWLLGELRHLGSVGLLVFGTVVFLVLGLAHILERRRLGVREVLAYVVIAGVATYLGSFFK